MRKEGELGEGRDTHILGPPLQEGDQGDSEEVKNSTPYTLVSLVP